MYTVIIVLLIIVAILTCGIVLIQESKGGGLASGFSSSNQVLGVRKTTDFLEKTTWTLAAIMVVLCVASAAFAVDNKNDKQAVPAPTQPVPAATQQAAPAANQEATPATNQEATPAEKPAAAPAEKTEPSTEK